jgi:NAD-dependent DNA ligase
MHIDHRPYAKFTSRARLEKSINSLLGIVEGIAIDGAINDFEAQFLNRWLEEHSELRNRHPYSELIPVVQEAVADGVLSQEEREDIIWLCERLRSTEFYDQTTADLQRLHAILGGVVADGKITEAELKGLSTWLQDHEHLKTCWPYDEVDSLIVSVMQDQRIDEKEHQILKSFFSEFVAVLDERTIVSPLVKIESSIVGVCAVCPEIVFSGTTFCFTGASSKHTRDSFSKLVRALGGDVSNSITKNTHYLVIGAAGNPSWAYSCYGRKVEKAVQLRRAGSRLLIVHENDFHDAVADVG